MEKLFLLVLFLSMSTSSIASLSKADHDAMVTNLNLIETGWVQTSVDNCNLLLNKSIYTWSDWKGFFLEYYSSHTTTSNLWDFLGYPMFYWFDQEMHFKLQQSHKIVFQAKLDNILNSSNLDNILSTNSAQREELFRVLKTLSAIVNSPQSVLADSSKSSVLQKIESWINKYPTYYKRGVFVNPATQPYRALLGFQLHVSLIEAKPLTTDRIIYLKNTIALTGKRADIFANHKLYIADNERMTDLDLEYINSFMNLIPEPLTYVRSLSNIDYYYSSGQTRIPDSYSNIMSINTFSSIGGFTENEFPTDVSPLIIDGFSIVVAHEITHTIDASYVSPNSGLTQRKAQLLQQAGNIDLQYLRSTVGGPFFQNAPQEFIASISNQWFSSSEHTLQLGIVRFRNGYKEPINQVLLFCEIFSLGANTSLFYRMGIQGNITQQIIPVQRDSFGHINRLTVNNAIYNFTLDNYGNVLSLVTETLPPAITNFNPTTGLVGTIVTLSGSNFDPLLANNTVKFNGLIGTVSAATPATLTTSVPAGATTGAISVTVGSQSASSTTNFIVITPVIVQIAKAAIDSESPWLENAYPNPTNVDITISFRIPEPLDRKLVVIKIYNSQGIEVGMPMNEIMDKGNYEIKWNPQGLTGLHIIRMKIGQVEAKAIKVLVK